jgi:tRNA(Ile)-lysidine synthase
VWPRVVQPTSASNPLTLAPEQVERFKTAVETLLRFFPEGGEPSEGWRRESATDDTARGESSPRVGKDLLLAVSGGPDSMAMLALAHAAFPGRVTVATIDHRLRPAAAAEAAQVAAYCAAIGVPHATFTPDTPITGASIQAQARTARYALLRHWAQHIGATALLTAHHADDQAETFLMRAVRGSGPAGLAGIRAARELAPGLLLLRPLLDWRRAELARIAADLGIPIADDPSNRDLHHDRTRFRALLAAEPLLDIPGLARAATHAAEANAALTEIADLLWRARAEQAESEVRIDLTDLPRELRRRLVRRAIHAVRAAAAITAPAFGDEANIETLLDTLDRQSTGTHAGVIARTKQNIAVFGPAPPRRLQ